MNIVCVAACTAGIAHTYIAREKLIKEQKLWAIPLKLKPREPLVQKMNYRRQISLLLTS